MDFVLEMEEDMRCGYKCIILYVVFLITALSCDIRPVENEKSVTAFVTSEDWSLSRSAAGNQDCNYKLYYLNFPKDKEGHYHSPYIAPVDLSVGLIGLEEFIWPYGFADPSFFEMEWGDRYNEGLVKCTGNIVGNEIISSWTCTGPNAACTWQAEKGLVDVENGSFEKNPATGNTRLYFRAWTEGASRVYITADFIDGQLELVKCGKTNLLMDAWMISGTPEYSRSAQIGQDQPAPDPPDISACINEGYYEFPSTSSPLVVKTHIVKPSGEIVREKTVTESWIDQALNFSTIDANSFSGFQNFATVAIRDDRAFWDAIWREHKKNMVPIPELPAVDFSQKMVIGVFLGFRPNSCYSVNITSIRLISGQKLRVIYHEDKPSDNGFCADVTTYPAHIVIADKLDVPVEFISQ